MSDKAFYTLCAALVLSIMVFSVGIVDLVLPIDCEKEKASGYIVSFQCR